MNKTQEKAIRKELGLLIKLFKKADVDHKVNTTYNNFKISGIVHFTSYSWFDDGYEFNESTVVAKNSGKSEYDKFINFDIDEVGDSDFIVLCGLKEKIDALKADINRQLRVVLDTINEFAVVNSGYYLQYEIIHDISSGYDVDDIVDCFNDYLLVDNSNSKSYRQPKTTSFPISVDYAAVVTEKSDIIKVGCQSINIKDIRKLVKLWDEYNPND